MISQLINWLITNLSSYFYSSFWRVEGNHKTSLHKHICRREREYQVAHGTWGTETASGRQTKCEVTPAWKQWRSVNITSRNLCLLPYPCFLNCSSPSSQLCHIYFTAALYSNFKWGQPYYTYTLHIHVWLNKAASIKIMLFKLSIWPQLRT